MASSSKSSKIGKSNLAQNSEPGGRKGGGGKRKTGGSGLTPRDPSRPLGHHNPPVETAFKPGQSGNPGGRPKILSEAYKARLAAQTTNRLFPGMTNAEVLADKAIAKAAKNSDPSLLREIRQASEGDKVTYDFKGMDDAKLMQTIAELQRELEELQGGAAGAEGALPLPPQEEPVMPDEPEPDEAGAGEEASE